MVEVGKKAPTFNLKGFHEGEFGEFSLEEFKGKWVVLFFYPGDFTFVWATEVSAVADRYNEFKDVDAEVLTISVYSSFVHKIWNDNELIIMGKESVPFPMLSDQSGKVGKDYGVYSEEENIEMRGRFIIDPDGNLQSYEVLSAPVGRNISEIIRQIKAFQLVNASGGKKATPSDWEPGKKTLTPGESLVGNVWKEWNVDDNK